MLLVAKIDPVPATIEEATETGRRMFEDFGIPVIEVGSFCPDSPHCPRCGDCQLFVSILTSVFLEKVKRPGEEFRSLVLDGAERKLEAFRYI